MNSSDYWRSLYNARADSMCSQLITRRDIAQKAKEAGAIAVVYEPIEPQILLRAIEHSRERVYRDGIERRRFI